MTNTEHQTTSIPPHPEKQNSYFIFPGLRELLLGLCIIVFIEWLTGFSKLSTLPLQLHFLATTAILLFEWVFILMVLATIRELTKGVSPDNPYGTFIFLPLFLCLWAYLVGLLFPALAFSFPENTEPTDIFIFDWLWYLLKSAWSVLTQMGHIYGWFTLLSSGLLPAHIYTRHGKAIIEKLDAA